MKYICWLKEEGEWSEPLDYDEVIDEYEGRGCPEGFIILNSESQEELDKYSQEGAAAFAITKRGDFRDYLEHKEAGRKEDQLQDRLDRDAQNDDDDDDGVDEFRPFDARVYTSNVKRELNELWGCQLESIMLRMRGLKPLQENLDHRRNHKEIWEKVRQDIIIYWRQRGLLKDWIKAKLAANGRKKILLPGNDPQENLNAISNWFEVNGLGDFPGIYLFVKGSIQEPRYIYLGQTVRLKTRMNQHFDDPTHTPWFGEADRLEVLYARTTNDLDELEYLSFLLHDPRENQVSPPRKGGETFQYLEFVRREIEELANDAF